MPLEYVPTSSGKYIPVQFIKQSKQMKASDNDFEKGTIS